MTYSTKLGRHIKVPLVLANSFSVAELEAATRRFADATPKDVRQAAEDGDVDAMYIVAEAKGDGYVAEICREYLQ